jgi:PIN domain nuclease of toxin-antitoxin system
MLNLDTHILLHALGGALSPYEKRLLRRHQQWGISAIVLWEIEKLYAKRRIGFGLDSAPMAEIIAQLTVWPISERVCLDLRRLDFVSDPADEIIAATSLTHNVPLVTRDEKIRASKVVRCL